MDDIDELLAATPPTPELPAARETVIRDAAQVQRRRRWLGRGRRAAILAATYVIGGASVWLWSHREMPRPTPEVADRRPPVGPPADPPASADPYRNDPPERLEKWAFLQTGEMRVDLYRRAGDGYLNCDDVQAALRCYRRALDGATAADLAIRADQDTWLLMSLKLARNKERTDAHVN
jgi:hypothetical protein